MDDTQPIEATYIIGVDGGGTKTKVVCADQDGKIVGEGMSGPTSLAATSVGAASFNLREAVRQATEQLHTTRFAALVMGLAGMDTPSEHEQAHQVFSEVLRELTLDRFELVNDTVIGLEGNSDNPNAVVLIAGTGSNCYGRNAQGQSAKTSGFDFLLTDQGSGYWLGHQVLRKAVASFDGTADKSLLEDLVCQHFMISSISLLKDKVYHPLLTKTEIASCAKLCADALQAGDYTAHELMDQVAADLFTMVNTLLNRLELNNVATDCVFVGSILTEIEYVQSLLKERLGQQFPLLQIKTATVEPVFGALELARSYLR